MRVRLLGTAAGGGLPQWNCHCRNCRGARAGTMGIKPRTQSCVAVSANDRHWFLINASMDIRAQIESFPPLHATDSVRGTRISGVLLTSADLDHVLGLMVLREGDRLNVYASPAIRNTITDHLHLDSVLNHYCGIDWHEVPRDLSLLQTRDGVDTGLLVAAFPVTGKPPRYAESSIHAAWNAIGYRFVDPITRGTMVCIPGVTRLDPAALDELERCDLLLIDGTFATEDEMACTNVGATTAMQMGHCPILGASGSLRQISTLRARQKVYIHINNTNPILDEASPERHAVEKAGVVVGEDGMEFQL